MLLMPGRKANQDIREEVKRAGLKLWQVSAEIGMHDSNFSRVLRQELLDEQKQIIFQAINKLSGGERNGKNYNEAQGSGSISRNK